MPKRKVKVAKRRAKTAVVDPSIRHKINQAEFLGLLIAQTKKHLTTWNGKPDPTMQAQLLRLESELKTLNRVKK
jgi:hypothetical protein